MVYVLEIRPQTKERPRFNGRIVYTAAKTRRYEEDLKTLYRNVGGKMYDGALSVDLEFHYATKDKKKWGKPKVSRPDVDNLVKGFCDALNGECWRDDSSIYSINAVKLWDSEDFIIFKVRGRMDGYNF